MNKTLLLIPHFNNQEGLIKSIHSINEGENIDVLVVDDGSFFDINEFQITENFNAKGQIFFRYLNYNKGIEEALNYGLSIAFSMNYKYLARLDCGDVCIGNRFKIQEEFLDKNSDIVLVGSYVNFVNKEGVMIHRLRLPTKDRFIRKKMYLNAMHIHPSIMFKLSIIKKIGVYPTKYKAAEDYAFFFKILKEFKVANLNRFLVSCEANNNGISRKFRKEQIKSRIRIILDNFYFGIYPVYGLLRSLILYITPNKVTESVKSIFKMWKKN